MHSDARNLGDLIAGADPHKAAIIDCRDWDRPQTISYSDLDGAANALARGFLRRGLVRGDRIAIVAANRHEFVAAYLGAMRAGLVPVPINAKFPPAMVQAVLDDCTPKLVLCDRERRAAVPTAVEFGSPEWAALRNPGPFTPVTPEPRETAMVLYTSGSSGKPKGVVLTHEGHLWAVRMRLRGGPYDHHRLLIAAPLFHMNGLGTLKFALAAGATVVLLPQFDTRKYIEAIQRFRATWLTAVPPMLAMMFREKALFEATDVSSVTDIRMGSAPVSASLMEAIRHALPRASVTNAYGTTEAGPVVFGAHPKGLPQPEMSVGYPHPQIELRLADGNNRNAEEGVLEMRCPALMLGYHNRPDVTPPFTDDGFYITGDVFRRDPDGFHYFVGRTDDMFVSGGENIFPGEVEALLQRHPAVHQALVMPFDNELKGQVPYAFIVAKGGTVVSEEDLKQFALANGPAYQHPRRVFFLEQFPLTGTNKVDRERLRQLVVAPK